MGTQCQYNGLIHKTLAEPIEWPCLAPPKYIHRFSLIFIYCSFRLQFLIRHLSSRFMQNDKYVYMYTVMSIADWHNIGYWSRWLKIVKCVKYTIDMKFLIICYYFYNQTPSPRPYIMTSPPDNVFDMRLPAMGPRACHGHTMPVQRSHT